MFLSLAGVGQSSRKKPETLKRDSLVKSAGSIKGKKKVARTSPPTPESYFSSSSSEGGDETTSNLASKSKPPSSGWKGWKKAFGNPYGAKRSNNTFWPVPEHRRASQGLEATLASVSYSRVELPRDLGDIWVDKVLSDWPTDISEVQYNPTLKVLVSKGVPDGIRGEYWKKAIGNQLKLTPDLYRILLIKLCSVRSQLLQYSQRYSNGLHLCGEPLEEALTETEMGPLDHIDRVKASIMTSVAVEIKRIKSEISRSTYSHHRLMQRRTKSCPRLDGRGPTSSSKSMGNFLSAQKSLKAVDTVSVDGTPSSSARYEVEFVKKSFEAIAVDLHRTVPRQARQNQTLLIARGRSFSPTSTDLQPVSNRGLLVSLRSILEAWVIYRPDIGYVQGMAYIAATLLFVMDEFSAFVCLANLLCKDTMYKFYRFELEHIKIFCRVFDHLLDKYFPKVSVKLQQSSFTSDVFLVEWWFTLFTRSLPPCILYRVWDHYLMDGHIVLFQTALGIVKHWQCSLEHLPVDEGLLLLTSGINGSDEVSRVHSTSRRSV
eukprot:Blabericola_migrator_1__3918@NODE_2185_length_3156_cov_92_176433_g69_i3_p1_GENE_NODE_2185_length_3156_cov_92_176433_g69_i3NODE_2185_length_3156_cov_92_176433_g69_i3_p1_ORF_typecomplete_len544_score73_51RabGAPTBC/PF00566_18/4_1e03RabGAPTBC/PF00566_18/4e42_NODE_2185_length_3156_cov_92_176433_g69_i313572988